MGIAHRFDKNRALIITSTTTFLNHMLQTKVFQLLCCSYECQRQQGVYHFSLADLYLVLHAMLFTSGMEMRLEHDELLRHRSMQHAFGHCLSSTKDRLKRYDISRFVSREKAMGNGQAVG